MSDDQEVVYVVRCTFESKDLGERFKAWLLGGHADEVCRFGGATASVVVWDDEPKQIEIRYVFPTRADFDRYEATEAPRLRAEGRERFPAGVTMSRATGRICHRIG